MSSPPGTSAPPLGRRASTTLATVGRGWTFAGAFFPAALRRPMHLHEILRQSYEIGVKTLPLVMLTGFITGMVFTKQSRPSLEAFGATSWLPSLVTTALVRSLAPLVTALICAGKVGSSIGAELGSMKVTEQIEAMEVSAIDPYKFLVVTRTTATMLMVPVLTMYFGFLGFLGAYLNVHVNEGTSWQAFVPSAFSSIEWIDVWGTLLRAVVFGFTIGIISCRKGFRAGQGTQGVGRAANAAVVQSMLAVFLEEILIVQLISLIRGWNAP